MPLPSLPPIPPQARLDTDPTWLKEVGFSLLDTFSGKPLDKEMADRCARLARASSASDLYKETKLWVHPAGVIVAVESFAYNPGDSLILNQVSVVSIEDRSLLRSEDRLRNGSFGTSTGRRLSISRGSHTGAAGEPSDSFKMAWSRAQAASQDGSLVPLDGWMDCIRDPVFSSHISAISSVMNAPLSVALDWSKEKFLASPTTIPSQQYRLCKLSFGSLKEKVLMAISRRTAHYPEPLTHVFGALFDDELKREISLGYGLGGGRVPSPADRRQYAMGQFANAFVDLAQDIPGMPERLSQHQQAVCAQWVQVLSDPRPAARTTWKSLPAQLPGVSALAAHDVLLTHTEFPGVWEKLESQVRAASNDQLLSWVRGQEGASPLALSIARVVLDIPNRGSKNGEQRRVLPRALGVLDYLVTRLGKEALVWETAGVNVWGHALGKSLNLPTDEDLVEIHNDRLNGFLDWAQNRQIDLPSIVRWSSDRDQNITGMEFMPHDVATFRRQWEDHGPEVRKEAADLHWSLLGALSSLTRRSVLDGLVQQTRSPDQSRSRPRL